MMHITSERQSERVVLISDERELVARVAELLNTKPGIEAIVAQAPADKDALFDLTYDWQASCVLLVEPITHYHPSGPVLRPASTARAARLRSAALRAAQSPFVSAFGWVRSTEMVDDLLANLRRRGTPYGALTLGPLLAVEAERAARPSTAMTLIDAPQAVAADQAGAVSIEQAAEQIAQWVAREGMRGGDVVAAEARGGALEAAVRSLGYEPRVLPRWRVRLNSSLGALALAPEGASWRLHGKPWLSTIVRTPADALRLATWGSSWASAAWPHFGHLPPTHGPVTASRVSKPEAPSAD